MSKPEEIPTLSKVDQPSSSSHPDIHWISISFILLLFISVGITSSLVYVAARVQDRVAIKDSTHLIKSILSDINSRLSDQLKDYSYWDEAVNNLVGVTDTDWADNNIGIYMFEEFEISASFVLNTENTTTYAMMDGKRVTIDAVGIFGKELSLLLENARSGQMTEPPIQANGLITNGEEVYLAAASVLSNFQIKEQKDRIIGSGWVLVYLKALDKRLLNSLTNNYMLSDLRITFPEAQRPDAAIPLIGDSRATLGYLAWTPRSPSKEMLAWLTPLVGAVFLLFAGITYVFLLKSRQITTTLINDITEIEKAQEALKKGEARYHSLFNNLPIAVIEKDWSAAKQFVRDLPAEARTDLRTFRNSNADLVVNLAQKISPLIFNSASLSMYNASSESEFMSFLQKPFQNSDELNAFCETLVSFANGENQLTLYYWQTSCSGTEMYTRETVFIPKVHSDTWVQVIHATEDITELWKAEKETEQALQQAKDANLAKSQFLATMSHELRTPLNAILGFSDVIRRQFFGKLDNAEYIEYANDIHESGDHLLTLINDILDISAIEAGSQHITKEDLSINIIVHDCAPIIIGTAEKKDITFTSEVQSNIPKLYGHKRSIKQILINLLSNAVKYTPPGGEIKLSISATDDMHIFNIKDNGLGIAEDKIPMLTKPFSRIEEAPYMSQEGTGLGMSIVSSLIEFHHGEMNIESQLGVGTTIIVKLPSSSQK